jgi:hypothetical protein
MDVIISEKQKERIISIFLFASNTKDINKKSRDYRI